MADISTGRQRGIVPFVDETTGRLPDQYLPQGVIDLQGDLEQAVTDAGASATAAKASAASATQSATAAAQSAESASGDATKAKASADEAASSAGAAKASETAAASSATAASASKDAAKASETAAAQSAQTATEQVSSIGDSVERAAASATAAQRSATEAASSASGASQSASAASTSASQAGESASQASGFASTASQAATTATGAASNASASASAAQQSASAASASASAAKASETNAASSASAAKVSETNAADSATAAREAVEGFGLEAGTTTTGEPGSDASVEIQKSGTKYTANFTIPRGDKGEQASVVHDATLFGDGTVNNALSVISSFKNATKLSGSSSSIFDPNRCENAGVYYITLNKEDSVIANIPPELNDNFIRASLVVCRCGEGSADIVQLWLNRSGGDGEPFVSYRINNGQWQSWHRLAFASDIPNVSELTSRIATLEAKTNELAVMQTRLQALEARIKSLETN